MEASEAFQLPAYSNIRQSSATSGAAVGNDGTANMPLHLPLLDSVHARAWCSHLDMLCRETEPSDSPTVARAGLALANTTTQHGWVSQAELEHLHTRIDAARSPR